MAFRTITAALAAFSLFGILVISKQLSATPSKPVETSHDRIMTVSNTLEDAGIQDMDQSDICSNPELVRTHKLRQDCEIVGEKVPPLPTPLDFYVQSVKRAEIRHGLTCEDAHRYFERYFDDVGNFETVEQCWAMNPGDKTLKDACELMFDTTELEDGACS